MEGQQNGQTNFKSGQSFGIVFLIGVLVTLFLVRWFVGAGNEIINVDERELLASVLDRLSGVPSTSLAWPASTIHVLLLPLASVMILVKGGFVNGLATLYSSPQDWIIFARLALLLICAFFAITHIKMARDRGNLESGLLSALVIISSPIYVFQSYLVTGDALGLWSMILAFGFLYYDQKVSRAFLLCGILTSFAIASRVGFALYLPLVLAIAWQKREKGVPIWNSLRPLCLGIGFGILVFMPYLWVDPIRMLKSIVGNAGRGGQGSFIQHLFQGFLNSGIHVWIIGIVITCLSERSKQLKSFAMLGYSLLMLIFLSRLGVVYDRYFMLVLPGIGSAIMVSTMGEHPLRKTKWKNMAERGLAVICAIGVGLMVPAESALREAAVSFRSRLNSLSTESIIYTSKSNFYEMDYRSVSKVSLEVIRNNQIGALGKSLSGQVAITHPLMKSVPWAFREDEQAFIGRTTVVLNSKFSGKMNVQLVETDEALAERTGIEFLDLNLLPQNSFVLLDVNLVDSKFKLLDKGTYNGVKFYLYQVQP